MALAAVAQALLDLREHLPKLIGEDWIAVEEEFAVRFDRLERATTPAEREAAIDALLSALMRFEALQSYARRALRAGSTTRRGRRAVVDRRSSALERWPHLDVDCAEPVPAGREFRATVYVDANEPRGAEVSRPLALPDVPEVRLRVVLVTSDQFAVAGRESAWITVSPDHERSTTAEFRLRVEPDVSGSGVITAFFAYDGRPAGSVHRPVEVGGAAVATRAEKLPAPALSADLRARRADLTVDVAAIRGSGRQRYSCMVSTPHLDEYADGIEMRWDLPEATTTRDIVATLMAGFTQARASNAARRAALVGAGLDLFRAAPENFQSVYWTLRDADQPSRRSTWSRRSRTSRGS